MMRLPCWCAKQWHNVAQVFHNNRIKFPKGFFRYCSVHQHGRRDVTWKPRIFEFSRSFVWQIELHSVFLFNNCSRLLAFFAVVLGLLLLRYKIKIRDYPKTFLIRFILIFAIFMQITQFFSEKYPRKLIQEFPRISDNSWKGSSHSCSNFALKPVNSFIRR